MSAETRGVSRFLVDLCVKYPLVALIFVPIAGYVVIGYSREVTFVQSTNGKQPLSMKVERVYNEVERPIFPKYRAAGQTSEGPAVVEIFKQDFRKLKAGDDLLIVGTGSNTRPFLTQQYATSALNSVRFSVGEFPMNDNAIFFAIFALVALVWGVFGRQIAGAFSESKPQSQQAERLPEKLNWPDQG